MMTPHKCPVCDGTGLVSRLPYTAGDYARWSSSNAGPWPCRACQGTGVLWMSDRSESAATLMRFIRVDLNELVAGLAW